MPGAVHVGQAAPPKYRQRLRMVSPWPRPLSTFRSPILPLADQRQPVHGHAVVQARDVDTDIKALDGHGIESPARTMRGSGQFQFVLVPCTVTDRRAP